MDAIDIRQRDASDVFLLVQVRQAIGLRSCALPFSSSCISYGFMYSQSISSSGIILVSEKRHANRCVSLITFWLSVLANLVYDLMRPCLTAGWISFDIAQIGSHLSCANSGQAMSFCIIVKDIVHEGESNYEKESSRTQHLMISISTRTSMSNELLLVLLSNNRINLSDRHLVQLVRDWHRAANLRHLDR
ncbi:hypothetical protein Tco_0304731 [Tanacetum coccineum]